MTDRHIAARLLPGHSVVGVLASASLPLMLVINRLDSIALGVLAITGLAIGFASGFRDRIDRPMLLLGGTLALLLAAPLLSYAVGLQDDLGFRVLGRYLRFLLLIPAALALRECRLSERDLRWGMTIGTFGLAVYLIAQAVLGHTGRVQGATGAPIVFGDIGAGSAVFAAAMWLYVPTPKRRHIAIAVLLLFIGVAAAAESGTRSAFGVLLLVGTLVALIEAMRGRYRSLMMTGASLLLLAAATIWVVASTALFTRISDLKESRGVAAYVFDPPPRDLIDARCPNDRRVLDSLLPHVGHPAWVRLSVSPVPTDAQGAVARAGCGWGYWITARNFSEKRNGWIWWHPELPPPSVSEPISAGTLVRGCGVAHIAGLHDQRHYCHRDGGEVQFKGKLPSPPISVLSFGRDNAIDFIPLQLQRGGIYYASFGLGSAYMRIAMWESAWHAFLEKPWIGGGPGWFRAATRRDIALRKVSPTIWGYDHPHNEYLFIATSSGILGLVSLVMFVWLAWRETVRWQLRNVALAFRITFIVVGLLCVAESLFIHSLAISWLVIFTAVAASAGGPYGRTATGARTQGCAAVETGDGAFDQSATPRHLEGRRGNRSQLHRLTYGKRR